MSIYNTIQELLGAVPVPGAPEGERARWVADFNAMSSEIEETVEADTTGAEDQVSLPPWEAGQDGRGTIWLYSPPLVHKTKDGIHAVRLAVNADRPVSGNHVNAKAVPVDETYSLTGRDHFACVIINTNAEQIENAPLVAVWFLWDSIARLGIKKGLAHGLITENWVDNVFRNAGKCGGKYPHAFYQRANKANEYLLTLYRLCEARGITPDNLHGSGWMQFNNKKGTDSTYRNSWVDEEGICACCKNERGLSHGSGRYPYGSILSHVKSLRHRRNAAEYLLRMAQDEATAAPEVRQDTEPATTSE